MCYKHKKLFKNYIFDTFSFKLLAILLEYLDKFYSFNKNRRTWFIIIDSSSWLVLIAHSKVNTTPVKQSTIKVRLSLFFFRCSEITTNCDVYSRALNQYNNLWTFIERTNTIKANTAIEIKLWRLLHQHLHQTRTNEKWLQHFFLCVFWDQITFLVLNR